MLVTADGGSVLGIGIDWAEEFHDIALERRKRVIEQFRIEHGPAGVAALIERALRLEPDPAEVRVVLEIRHGLLVEALLDTGFTVIPVNPDVVARRRGPARKKDDAEDARICCLLALDRHATLKTLTRTASSGASCGRSAVTTSAPSATSGGCSIGCAPTCSATPVPHRPIREKRLRRRPPARTTTISAPRSINGRSAASPEAAGRASSTTAKSPPGNRITPPCAP